MWNNGGHSCSAVVGKSPESTEKQLTLRTKCFVFFFPILISLFLYFLCFASRAVVLSED